MNLLDPQDLRNQYLTYQWQQGQLLSTPTTRRWSQEEKDRGSFQERCMSFVHFTILDQGKSRTFIHKYDTPELCKNAVDGHNRKLQKQRDEEYKKGIHKDQIHKFYGRKEPT